METSQDLDILAQSAERAGHTIQILRRATPQELTQALAAGPCDLFHFAGTGAVLPKSSRTGALKQALRLMDPDGRTTALLDRQTLGNLLQRSGVRVAVLNACHSDWVARSLAKYIPAAIGLREWVSTQSCVQLCNALYDSLFAGASLDLAVTATRQALDRAAPGTGEWCKLIFYLQQTDGTFLRRPIPVEAPSPDVARVQASQNKEVLKLGRLLEVYEKNLAVSRNGDLEKKTADLKQRLQGLLDPTRGR